MLEMKKRKLFIKMPYLKMIDNGSKPLEARANYPNLRSISEGDQVTFLSGKMNVPTLIKRVTIYKTVDEMLKNENIDHLIPGSTYSEARKAYNDIYPSEKVRNNNGMVVFELERI